MIKSPAFALTFRHTPSTRFSGTKRIAGFIGSQLNHRCFQGAVGVAERDRSCRLLICGELHHSHFHVSPQAGTSPRVVTPPEPSLGSDSEPSCDCTDCEISALLGIASAGRVLSSDRDRGVHRHGPADGNLQSEGYFRADSSFGSYCRVYEKCRFLNECHFGRNRRFAWRR
jgi:hypothetical protein